MRDAHDPSPESVDPERALSVDIPAHLKKVKLTRQSRKTAFKRLKQLKTNQLDAVIHEEHDRAFERVRCQDCAHCCETTSPIFTDRDIPRIAKHLGMRPSAFTDRYLRLDDDQDYVLKSSPCPFLDTDKACLIYDVRPKACREYPHTDAPKQRHLIDLTEKNVEVCPAVFEMMERVSERLLGLKWEESETRKAKKLRRQAEEAERQAQQRAAQGSSEGDELSEGSEAPEEG